MPGTPRPPEITAVTGFMGKYTPVHTDKKFNSHKQPTPAVPWIRIFQRQ